MANITLTNSPLNPILGLSDSFFQASPFKSPNDDDSFDSFRYCKQNNLTIPSKQCRTFSPGSKFSNSPNISPIIKKMETMTIAEEPEGAAANEVLGKTFVIEGTPKAPSKKALLLDAMHKRRTMFEHKFNVDTLLEEAGMEKYCDLFRDEEINVMAFLTLDDMDLITIGITNENDRMEILKAVETYQFLK